MINVTIQIPNKKSSIMYDAVVAGGSISGLLAAREIAKGGYSVLVLEEGFELAVSYTHHTQPTICSV